MFGKEKNGIGKRTSDAIGKINLIGSGTSIEGEVKTDSDIRIDGTVKGNIHSQAKVVIGENGNIHGDIHCQEADIHGNISGNIFAAQLLHLKAPAKVRGDMHTKKLVVEAGAEFNGQSHMGDVSADIHAARSEKGRENGQRPTRTTAEKVAVS
ncbi:MAG: polymer-forming cytoskeletal protein [Bacteroidia bacterium]